MGVSLPAFSFSRTYGQSLSCSFGFRDRRKETDRSRSITKSMGESFKLHAQALSGYDDALASGTSGTTTPTMSSAPAPELEIETTVY